MSPASLTWICPISSLDHVAAPPRVATILWLDDVAAATEGTVRCQVGQGTDLQPPALIVSEVPMEDIQFVEKHPILSFTNIGWSGEILFCLVRKSDFRWIIKYSLCLQSLKGYLNPRLGFGLSVDQTNTVNVT